MVTAVVTAEIDGGVVVTLVSLLASFLAAVESLLTEFAALAEESLGSALLGEVTALLGASLLAGFLAEESSLLGAALLLLALGALAELFEAAELFVESALLG